MKAITVSVQFGDLLALTLPANSGHFDEVLVVTTEQDRETIEVVQRVSNARLLTTDAFYRHGAAFNKGLAIEEALDVIGREGWICTIDADILMPRQMRWPWETASFVNFPPSSLYAPRRHNLVDLTLAWVYQHDPSLWERLPQAPDGELAGCFHLFHASDPVLGPPPWYGTDWIHAGGYDSDFIARWPAERHCRLPFVVLHLGQDGKNWFGRCTRRVDGTMPHGADERHRAMRRMHRLRSSHGYAKEKLSREDR